MRSEAVFQASSVIKSRYNLCRICAKGTRKLHFSSDRIQDTINAVLAIIGRRKDGKFLLSAGLQQNFSNTGYQEIGEKSHAKQPEMLTRSFPTV
jgi:hypothetical protein